MTTHTDATPGFNRRMTFAFTADRRGRPVAYYWSGRGYPGNPIEGRWIRTGYDAAKVAVAQGFADETTYGRCPC